MDAKQYIETLAQTANLPVETKATLLKALDENQTFAKSLEEGVMLRSDYSRQSDELKKVQASTSNYYQQLVQWQKDKDAEYAAPVQPATGEYLTKKDLDALEKKYQDEFTRREQVQIALLKDGMRLASQHAVDFKEALDTEALAKIAVEKNISLRAAYDDMTAPRRAELQTQSFAAKLAAAKEEGAMEFASKHKIPVDTGAREPEFGRLSFTRDPKQAGIEDYVPNSGRLTQASSNKLREGFVSEWDKAPAANTSGT